MHIFVTATKLLPPVGTGHLLVRVIHLRVPIYTVFTIPQPEGSLSNDLFVKYQQKNHLILAVEGNFSNFWEVLRYI